MYRPRTIMSSHLITKEHCYKKHSDWLCRMVTGGGYSTRRLYTNTEEEVFSVSRPIILNGITQIADQPDLIDRSIFINMPVIDAEHEKTRKRVAQLSRTL